MDVFYQSTACGAKVGKDVLTSCAKSQRKTERNFLALDVAMDVLRTAKLYLNKDRCCRQHKREGNKQNIF